MKLTKLMGNTVPAPFTSNNIFNTMYIILGRQTASKTCIFTPVVCQNFYLFIEFIEYFDIGLQFLRSSFIRVDNRIT
eukprot:UN29486